jgi:hypothetical protein
LGTAAEHVLLSEEEIEKAGMTLMSSPHPEETETNR